MNGRIYLVKKKKSLKVYDRINMQHIGIFIPSKQRLITYTLLPVLEKVQDGLIDSLRRPPLIPLRLQ